MKNKDIFQFRVITSFRDSIVDDIENKTLSPLSWLREFDSCWMLEVDLPLVKEKDVKVRIINDSVDIEAKLEKKFSQESLGQITKFECFKKIIVLPGKIDDGKINTRFQKGRLMMNIGKK